MLGMTLYTYSMSRNISSEAIVLSSKSIGEADKLVTVFSKNFGKMTLIAKGVKRLKSRKRGTLEPFSIIKFSGISAKGIPLVNETSIINNLSLVRTDLKKVSVAYFFVEVIMRATQDEEPNQELYSLLENNLIKLESDHKLKKLRQDFSIKLAEILGFIPTDQFVPNTDELIEAIIERKLGSIRVGKKLQV